uniref:Uncharacterized protein n=1 Tax=Arundo donax TaxID=35708 RepID=A0A0A9C2P9_ARUDO
MRLHRGICLGEAVLRSSK